MKQPIRPTRDDVCMRIAGLMATRSTCLRAQVGAVITREFRLISSGYNGAPSGLLHCGEETCLAGDLHGCENTVHAELNAIVFAARCGIATEGCTLYTTHLPCPACARAIINAGIARVVFSAEYRLSEGMDLLRQAGVTLKRWT